MTISHPSCSPRALMTASLLALLALPSLAQAQTKLYDWPQPEAPVALVGDQGIIFLHPDGKPYRAYNVAKGTTLHVVDMDRNGRPDIIGLGKPTFLISGDTSPMWFMDKGCKSAVVADIVADDKLDVACTDGKELKVYTHDNQFAWGIGIGRNLKNCRAGDTNGDNKAEIECQIGSKQYARFESGGSLVSADIDEPMIEEDALPFTPFSPAADAVFTEKTTYDLDMDGTAEEYLEMEDQLLVVKSRSKQKPLMMLEVKDPIQGALVKNLDQKEAPEIVILTSKELLVLSPEGKRQDRYPLKSSAYKRKPVADLQSVYANGFADNAAAQKAVTDIQEKLAACYASQLKKTQFAGSGRLLYQVKVDDKGKTTGLELMHSEIADGKVAKCAEGLLKKISYPAAASADTPAALNVTILYTFRDLP